MLKKACKWKPVCRNFSFPAIKRSCCKFECFKWQVVCSLNRTQGCRKQQGYLFQMNTVTPLNTSQWAHARLVSYTWINTPPLNFTHDLCHSCKNTASASYPCNLSVTLPRTQPLLRLSTQPLSHFSKHYWLTS